ncbi:MAG: sigma-54 dependent transcriptional regulator, partial [bacterium]
MAHQPHILIADDEEGIRFVIGEALRREGYEVTQARDGEEALTLLRNQKFDIAILDVKMPKRTGIEVLSEGRRLQPDQIFLMITAYGSREIALQAIREGAYDYFTKPFEIEELRIVVKRALEKASLLNHLRSLEEQLSKQIQFDRIIGQSEVMQDVYRLIKRVTQNDVTILIQGESGTGKDLVAQAIHYHGPRKNAAFVKVNCAAIPETLLESEFFGHERGAFTGAVQLKRGKFEAADGGTLFLDEIAELPTGLQAKLLRVLQDQEFERVGGTKSIKVDVRIIAATNRNIVEAVQKKVLREDLYFRLNVIPFFMPPLRERKSDIPLLVDHFIAYYNTKFGRKLRGVTHEVMDFFSTYAWPGNIRELENVLQRAIILTQEDLISMAALPPDLISKESKPVELVP